MILGMAKTEEGRERHRIYMRDRYRNDEEYRERHKAIVSAGRSRKRDALRDLIAKEKEGGCVCCPEREPICLDFHHPGSDKDFAIGDAIRRCYSIARVKAEMAKCVLLCANCHRKAHAGLLVLPSM